MKRDRKISNRPFEQKLDFFSNLTTVLLCILINVWTSVDLVFLIKNNMGNVFLYIIYGFLDVFCLIALFAIGKKMCKMFSQCHQRSREDSSM